MRLALHTTSLAGIAPSSHEPVCAKRPLHQRATRQNSGTLDALQPRMRLARTAAAFMSFLSVVGWEGALSAVNHDVRRLC